MLDTMNSALASAIDVRSGDENPSPHQNTWIMSEYEHGDIVNWYVDHISDGMDTGDELERYKQLTQWYEWCDQEYPDAADWHDVVASAGTDVDIRLLIKGYDIAGYAILVFLEACYAVDRVFCGNDAESLAKVEKWHIPQEMKAYRYLSSRAMMSWWAEELAGMEQEIKSQNVNRVSLSWKLDDLKSCLHNLETVVGAGEGIGTEVWTRMGELSGSGPPSAVSSGIFERVWRLKKSVKILQEALQRSERGDFASAIAPSTNHGFPEFSGIRRRIPHAASPSSDGQTTITHEDNSSAVASASALIGAKPNMTGPKYILQYAMDCIQRLRTRRETRHLLSWFSHTETAIVISFILVATSVYFMAWSVILAKSQSTTSSEYSLFSDVNYLGDVSQFILSNLSIYLIVASTISCRSKGLRYEPWLWLCLFVSSLSSILGLSLYSASPIASMVFLWTATFAQVVIPILLIIREVEIDPGKKDDIEGHRD